MTQIIPTIESITNRLQKAGFGPKTALVYAYLVNKGGAFPSKIAEDTKLNRSTVYKILLDLSIKGVVGEIEKKGKLYYQLEKPQRLKQMMKWQVDRAEQNMEAIESFVPELSQIWAGHASRPRVSYFEGADELRLLYLDHVNDEPHEMLAISNSSEITKVLSPRWLKETYIKKKNRAGIPTRAIIPDTSEDHAYVQTYYANVQDKVKPQIKTVPGHLFPFEAEIIIYGPTRLSIIDLTHTYPLGVMIEDATIANTMRMVFEILWARD